MEDLTDAQLLSCPEAIEPILFIEEEGIASMHKLVRKSKKRKKSKRIGPNVPQSISTAITDRQFS